MTTTTEIVEPEKPKKSGFSLLKLALSTPFAILMLGLSMLSFLKRNDVLSFKGFLDSLVEMFHGVTYAISKWVVGVIDWMLPWWELKLTEFASDVLWFTIILGIPYIRIPLFHGNRISVIGLLVAIVVYLIWFFAFANQIKEHLPPAAVLIFLTPVIIISIMSFHLFYKDNIARSISISFFRNLAGAALIILSLYFAGFIELTA